VLSFLFLSAVGAGVISLLCKPVVFWIAVVGAVAAAAKVYMDKKKAAEAAAAATGATKK
jgi:hypothetical protein